MAKPVAVLDTIELLCRAAVEPGLRPGALQRLVRIMQMSGWILNLVTTIFENIGHSESEHRAWPSHISMSARWGGL